MDRTANAETAVRWSEGSNPSLSASWSSRAGECQRRRSPGSIRVSAHATQQVTRLSFDCDSMTLMLRFGYGATRPKDLRSVIRDH